MTRLTGQSSLSHRVLTPWWRLCSIAVSPLVFAGVLAVASNHDSSEEEMTAHLVDLSELSPIEAHSAVRDAVTRSDVDAVIILGSASEVSLLLRFDEIPSATESTVSPSTDSTAPARPPTAVSSTTSPLPSTTRPASTTDEVAPATTDTSPTTPPSSTTVPPPTTLEPLLIDPSALSRLELGSKGSHVQLLTRILQRLDYAIDVSTDFTEPVRVAVEDFQALRQLTIDGIVGKQTWTALAIAIGELEGTSETAVSAFNGLTQLESSGEGDVVLQGLTREKASPLLLADAEITAPPESTSDVPIVVAATTDEACKVLGAGSIRDQEGQLLWSCSDGWGSDISSTDAALAFTAALVPLALGQILGRGPQWPARKADTPTRSDEIPTADVLADAKDVGGSNPGAAGATDAGPTRLKHVRLAYEIDLRGTLPAEVVAETYIGSFGYVRVGFVLYPVTRDAEVDAVFPGEKVLLESNKNGRERP